MATSTRQLTSLAAYNWGAVALFAAAAVILAALGFEHLGGYEPCPLCLQQRYAYYAGIPLLFVALVCLSAGLWRAASALFLFVAIVFLANAGLGVYHAGIEWGFWPGPETCAAGAIKPLEGSGSLLKDLANKQVASCGDAQVRFLGLSFAGWNVIASLGLMTSGLKAAAEASEIRS